MASTKGVGPLGRLDSGDRGDPHRVRRRAAIAAALALSGSTASADGREPRHCARSVVRDVAADVRGRIYEDRRQRFYACLRSRNRPVPIGRTAFTFARVASPFAAVSAGSRLRVVDMRRGTKRSVAASGALTDLVLTARGDAAFVSGTRVQRMDATGTATQLDQGGITAGSLAVSKDGQHLYWLKDGVPQTAAVAVRARAARRCARSGVKVLAADDRGRIYADADDEIFACLRSRDRAVPWEETGDQRYAARVASPYAALVSLTYTSSGDGDDSLQVLDMRDGSSVGCYMVGALRELVLNSHGVAAFVDTGPTSRDGVSLGPPTVKRLDQRNQVVNLDEGNIGNGSLALSPDGRHVYWTKDDKARTAAL